MKRRKSQTTYWEKISANLIPDKELVLIWIALQTQQELEICQITWNITEENKEIPNKHNRQGGAKMAEE